MSGIYTDPGHVILYTSNGEVRQECSIVLTARATGGQPTPSAETSEVRWVPLAEVGGIRWIRRCGCVSSITPSAATAPTSVNTLLLRLEPAPVAVPVHAR